MNHSILSFENSHDDPLPPEFQGQDVRLPERFVRYILEQYTEAGDVVLDPFTGFATTLIVAEQLGRLCYGIEADRKRYEFGLSKLKRGDLLIHGSSLEIESYNLPALDLVFFSPPYMHKSYERNPLRSDLHQENCYSKYLEDLRSVVGSAWRRLNPDGHLVIEVSNLVNDEGVTTLAWDIASLLSRDFHFKGEKVINWIGGYGYGYDHSYCLIFNRDGKA